MASSADKRWGSLHEDYSDVDDYEMQIETTVVEKLGLKLYDKASAVLAELVANSYDADAENVHIRVPLGKFLAVRQGDGRVDEKGYEIEVIDDGHGMTPQEAQKLFLRVGRDRRDEQGDKSREKGRPVMGRKGIGKLAPFGICDKIEIISAGGPKDQDQYKVSHFRLDYDEILAHEDATTPYTPERGEKDGDLMDDRGTKIVMKDFNVKKVPGKETFSRQLSYKFAKGLPDFSVLIEDIKEDDPADAFNLEDVDIPIQDGTKVDASQEAVEVYGEEYPVEGWLGMAKEPYSDEFGGVRIYVRGKLASITNDFGMASGWTGEYVARSYLVGEIHCDWLDDEQDLVQTHRQDIIWESDYGNALQEWGSKLVKKVARKGREPRRQKVQNEFMEKSGLENKAKERFGDRGIADTAVELGENFGKFAHEDELDDEMYLEDFSDFVLQIAPHKHLVDAFHEIREKAEGKKIDMDELIELFEATKIAEYTTYGQVAAEKISAIEVLEENIREEGTTERDLHEILEDAPWLVNAEWQPITSEKSLDSFRDTFEEWYEDEHGEEITTTAIEYPSKRPDLVMIHVNNAIRVIELKKPDHAFDEDDFERFQNYVDAFEDFFDENNSYLKDFPEGAKFILVCDDVNLPRTEERAFELMKGDGTIEVRKTWEDLLRDTKRQHQDFISARNQIPVDVEVDSNPSQEEN